MYSQMRKAAIDHVNGGKKGNGFPMLFFYTYYGYPLVYEIS